MKRFVFVSLIAGFIFLNSCSNSNSPTSTKAPEPVKPRATYTGLITVDGWYYSYFGTISFNWKYVVTNTNGIGATVLRSELYYYHNGTGYTGHTWYPQGTSRIEGNGTYTWTFNFDSYSYPGFLPDKAQVKMYVKDDNGYDETIWNQDPVTIIWH
jgi:hypothetical protein